MTDEIIDCSRHDVGADPIAAAALVEGKLYQMQAHFSQLFATRLSY
jgi:hypothetical protein